MKDCELDTLDTWRWCPGCVGEDSGSGVPGVIGDAKSVCEVVALDTVGLGSGRLLYEVGSSTGGEVLGSDVPFVRLKNLYEG